VTESFYVSGLREEEVFFDFKVLPKTFGELVEDLLISFPKVENASLAGVLDQRFGEVRGNIAWISA